MVDTHTQARTRAQASQLALLSARCTARLTILDYVNFDCGDGDHNDGDDDDNDDDDDDDEYITLGKLYSASYF